MGFPGDYFHKFALSLQSVGFVVYWVCTSESMKKGLKQRQGIKEEFLCCPVEGFNPNKININSARYYLSQIEVKGYPTFNDIILMDRILIKKDPELSIKFLYHIAVNLNSFFKENNISLINSGRDNAIQLTSMLLAKKFSIPWVVPTRMRIPKNMYGFCSTHETNSFIKISEPNTDDYEWAAFFLTKYLNEDVKPELKISAMNFYDVVKLIPTHFNVFRKRLSDAFVDMNNTFTRYTISEIIFMYLMRRINMIKVYLLRPFEDVTPNSSFVLYTLHTQPESSIDVSASFFSNQIEVIKQIARSLPLSHQLYVKVHPTDVDGKNMSFYKAIKAIPSVRLIHFKYDTKLLIEQSDLIFTLTGTIALEAGLRSKNVITLANNYFNKLPTVNYCTDLKKLPQLIKEVLNNKSLDDNRRNIIEFLASMKASCFEGEINRDYGSNPTALTQDDLIKLCHSYTVLYNTVTTN